MVPWLSTTGTLEWGGCGIQSCLGQALGLAGRIPRPGTVSSWARGRLCRPAVLRVSGCACSPAQVCCDLFLLSWFRRWGPAHGPELHGWPAGGPCLPRLAASRLACLHAAGLTFTAGWGSLVSACLQPLWSSLAPSSSSRQGSGQPGWGLNECPWTADVAALLARRGAVAGGGRWAVFTCVTGSERSPASTLPAPSKFGAAEARAGVAWFAHLPGAAGGRAGLTVAAWAPPAPPRGLGVSTQSRAELKTAILTRGMALRLRRVVRASGRRGRVGCTQPILPRLTS